MRESVPSDRFVTYTTPSAAAMPYGRLPTSMVVLPLPSGATLVTVSLPLLATHRRPPAKVTPTGRLPTGIGAPATCGPDTGGWDDCFCGVVAADEESLLPPPRVS